jgi:UDP-GlcNAc3NAcA epimerase
MKIVTVVGARPQFIKAAPLSRVLRAKHTEILVHTGQHYDENMSDIFFTELNIPKPEYNLHIGSASHGKQTGDMLAAIEDVLIKEKPDYLLVYGDTNSTIAGALAASKLHIKVAHVEAGLRSFDRTMPEEINRVLTDHISDLLFAPTDTAIGNLKNEGITKGVHNVGDIMMDAVIYNANLSETNSKILSNLGIISKNYYLATIHRASNTDNIDNLKHIFAAFNQLNKQVILPLHPRTKGILTKNNINTNNIKIIEPVGYLDMLKLTKNAAVIVTDSGGLQKEAYILGTPCVTVRETTEWVETVSIGANKLAGTDASKIIELVNSFKNYTMPQVALYGDGKAAQKIINILEKSHEY